MKAQAACDELEHMGDRSPETRDLMARNLLYLCRLYHGTEHFDESIATGTRAKAIFRQLVADHPDQFSFAHQLFLAHAELGLSHLSADRPEEAIAAYEGARRTLKLMTATFGRLVSRMAAIQNWLAETDYNLMDAYDTNLLKYFDSRRDVVSEAYAICDKLGIIGPLHWNTRIVYAATCYEMACDPGRNWREPDVGLLIKSEQLWAEFLRESPADAVARTALVVVRRQLADLQAKHGRSGEASRLRSQCLTAAQGHPEAFYDGRRLPNGFPCSKRDPLVAIRASAWLTGAGLPMTLSRWSARRSLSDSKTFKGSSPIPGLDQCDPIAGSRWLSQTCYFRLSRSRLNDGTHRQEMIAD